MCHADNGEWEKWFWRRKRITKSKMLKAKENCKYYGMFEAATIELA